MHQPHESVIHDQDRLLRLTNAVKRAIAPVAIAAAGLASAHALEAPAEALAETTHPAHHFKDYNQGDWGSRIASSGCGPTAIAMVVATETGNSHVNPATITKQITPRFYAYGSGTEEGAFKYIANRYHLSERHTNLNETKEVLRENGLAIVHAKPGHFTSLGHYMVLRALENGRFRLADPNGAPGRDSERRLWTAGQLKANGIDDVWAFQPKVIY
jgi:hypothetical protein